MSGESETSNLSIYLESVCKESFSFESICMVWRLARAWVMSRSDRRRSRSPEARRSYKRSRSPTKRRERSRSHDRHRRASPEYERYEKSKARWVSYWMKRFEWLTLQSSPYWLLNNSDCQQSVLGGKSHHLKCILQLRLALLGQSSSNNVFQCPLHVKVPLSSLLYIRRLENLISSIARLVHSDENAP